MKINFKYIIVFSLLFFISFIFYFNIEKEINLFEIENINKYLKNKKFLINNNKDSNSEKKEYKNDKTVKLEQNKGVSKEDKIKELITKGFNSPINFWGKVIDQNGSPIAAARCDIDIDSKGGNTRYVVFTNDQGLFELTGKTGASAYVKVSKDGFESTSDGKIGSDVSARMIYYSMDVMPSYAPPTIINPQVFMLRKKNMIANLSYATKKKVACDKNGKIQKIELITKGKIIEIEIRCLSNAPVPFNYQIYDWSAEIQIVGGKLRSFIETDHVTAPTEGYSKIFKIEMSKKNEDAWKSSTIKQKYFWIQFNDETYAKACIEVKTGRVHEVDIEVWYNLDKTNNFEK